MEQSIKCCICGCEIKGYGNNPYGACWKDENNKIVTPTFDEEDRCCDECNGKFVIPGRLYLMSHK